MKIFFAAVAILFLTVAAIAQTTNSLSDAEIQGRNLANQLYFAAPATNLSQKGILIVRNSTGSISNMPVIFSTKVETNYWESSYVARPNPPPDVIPPSTRLYIIHRNGRENEYRISRFKGSRGRVIHSYFDEMAVVEQLTEDQIVKPFANSDFWICDLGLEFFHWPAQKILKKESRRTRACMVLESTNPNPSTNGYSRVVSWIDEESGGIVFAEAYDAKGKLLKEFEPKSFKKVNGQWELKDMEIRNVQTKSRTRIEFDLKKN